MTTADLLNRANRAKTVLALASTKQKNDALFYMAQALENAQDEILKENERDLSEAKGTISPVMLDRLALSKARILAMANGMREVANLPDPVGRVQKTVTRENKLVIEKTAVPMGVIAIIYESRPNVTSDAAALALKAGSACVLRSGKQAHRSAKAIVAALQAGLEKAMLPKDGICLIEDTTRQSATQLMQATGLVDLLIPRGGAGLIRACVDNALVPVLETGTGICHIYIDKDANEKMALDIIENAKCSRPSVCNAAEVCLVHKDIAHDFLPKLKSRLQAQQIEKGNPAVSLRLCPAAAQIIEGQRAQDDDFSTEFLDYILAVRVVNDLDDAISHIGKYSTGHSDCIITEDESAAAAFIAQIDSAAVYWNASTRFTDGGEFGLGCEMGISTQKLHARGPLGLEELCTYKFVVRGSGQIR